MVNQQEINLKSVFKAMAKNKWWFILSLCFFLALAFAHIKLSTPLYEASTSILIDVKGSSRVLGDSRYVDGGVSLIEMEKNLYNEIGILKSFGLVRQTVNDLRLDVSYYTDDWPKKRERYGYFPFEVKLVKNEPQIYGLPFEIRILDADRYILTVEGSDFKVSNPINGTTREVTKNFRFSKELAFEEKVVHDYFNFKLSKPEYPVSENDFKGEKLSFVVHNLENVVKRYMSKLSVDNIDLQASIFQLTTTGPLVAKEVDFLNRLTENYIQNKLESRARIAASKEAFIRNQLRIVSDSLSRVEKDLEMFKKNKRALNLSATANNALGQSSNLQAERAKIEMNIKYYTSLIQNIEENKNGDDFVIPTAVGIDDPLINANIMELKTLYADRSRKKFFVTSTNEEMSILNKQIMESTDLLLNNLRNAIKSSEFELQEVNSRLSSYDGVISSLPRRENELLTIERQSTLYENLFNYLSQELAKTGIAGAESTSDARVLDRARMTGNGPVSPKKTLIMSMSVFLGTLIPLVWFVLFAPNDTIETIGQIKASTDIPVIAGISHYDPKARKSKSDISLWKLKESFRDLTANLKLFGSMNENVIAVTSIMPEEGKTYTAINLGITLAEAGKKTLIVDTDLRSPSLVDQLQKVKGKGLSNYLRGEITGIKDIVYQHETLPQLQFIPTHVVDGNVQGLLSGPKMKQLIQELKKKYDYIVLDTPAVGLVSDYLLFWEVIDINLFVVRRQKSKLSFLEDFEDLIPRNKRKKSAIIFNDALGKDYKYGYGQKYGINEEKQLVSQRLSV